MKKLIISIILSLISTLCLAAPTGLLLNINSAIGPAAQNYIQQGLDRAQQEQAALIILQLDTPGGLERSMHEINKLILASPIPIVTYVAPNGARAASAGTFIMYASPIAAMAPGTNIGAASPVALNPEFNSSAKTAIEQQSISTHERKAINDAVAYIRGLAQLYGRNAQWAEDAVRHAASLSAEEALKLKVIDVIANDVPDLLKKINGRALVLNGKTQTVQTENLIVTDFKANWRIQFLNIITDPNIAYILLLIGIYGLFLEFYHPGFILPGIVGVISLLISLYAFQLLPINYVGFALLLLGVIFMMIEIFISSFGILAIAGIAAFATGSILLLDLNSPGYQIAWSLILSMTIFTIGFFLVIINMAIRAMRKSVVTGREALIGSEGIVMENLGEQWVVKIGGEIWNAQSNSDLKPQQAIRVTDINGLVLTVEPISVSKQKNISEIS